MKKLRNATPFMHVGRVRFLRVFGLVLFGLILVKLALVQFVWKDQLLAAFNRQLHKCRELHAERGSILDSRGNPLAVELMHYYELEINPRQIRNTQKFDSLVHEAAGMKRHELQRMLDKEMRREKPREYVVLARDVPEPQVRSIKDRLIHGLYINPVGRRIYPQGAVAGNLLGILNHKGRPVGGLESCYNNLLGGEDGFVYLIKTAGGREHATSTRQGQEPRPGADLELFLDLRYQAIAEEELAVAIDKWEALSGQILLMDPEQGSLLALASWPPLDPNNRSGYTSDAARIRCISDMYEPGSTFKLASFAAMLEEGVIHDMSEQVPCHKGRYRVANRVIHDSERDGYDSLSVAEVFTLSSNIGTVVLAERMEREALFVMVRNLGFGTALGLDLPGESRGLLPPLDRWGPVEYANISMGQGIAATALQVACAFGAVANDGVLVRPRLLDRIVDRTGSRRTERVVIRKAMSRNTARQMQDLLRLTVTDGTGKLADSPHFPIYGKTGTAQKVLAAGGYSNKDYIASFAGFADVDGRRLTGLVLVDTPRGSIYGGTVAAPVFRKVLERISCVDLERRNALEPIQWSGNSADDLPLSFPDPDVEAQLQADAMLVEARP